MNNLSEQVRGQIWDLVLDQVHGTVHGGPRGLIWIKTWIRSVDLLVRMTQARIYEIA